MRSLSITAAIVPLLLAIPMAAQTTAELLQRGIFAQETEGNLDNAIAIYRQVVQSSSPQRDLVAQAQLRLGQALLQKGSLDLAAAEFQRLARDFRDQQETISRMVSQARMTRDIVTVDTLAGRMGEIHKVVEGEVRAQAVSTAIGSSTFDLGRPVTVQGTIAQANWTNPTGSLMIATKDREGDKYLFALVAPNLLVRQGMTRNSFRIGQLVTVTGVLADDAKKLPGGEFVAKASTITAQDGTVVWDRNRPPAPDQAAVDQLKQALQQMQKAAEAQRAQSQGK